MKKFRFLIAAILIIALIMTITPSAFAASFKTSETMINIIKQEEGFKSHVYYFNGAYYIGYGYKCSANAYPNGIPESGADWLLRDKLKTFENYLNSFLSKNNITLNQAQFDALIDLSYSMGSGWLNGVTNRLPLYLKNGYTNYSDVEIADSIVVFSHFSTTPNSTLAQRRIRDAKIFLYGDYSGKGGIDFCYMITDVDAGEYDNDIFCFIKGEPYGNLPIPSGGDGYFAGWQTSDGQILSPNAIVSDNISVKATWSPYPVDIEQYTGDPESDQHHTSQPEESFTGMFTDVDSSNVYFDAIEFCAENGIMNGTSLEPPAFSPDLSLSRAMLVTILWRAAGSPESETSSSFTDLVPDSYYIDAVDWAQENKVVTGLTEYIFKPEDPITRQQLAAVIYRYASSLGVDTQIDYGSITDYSDSDNIASYAYDAVYWAGYYGVLEANSRGMFNPASNATRAQAAQAVMTMILMLQDE